MTLGETRLTQDLISKPERIMKKNLLALGLICATAFTLTNCSKELENPSRNDSPFEIIAGTGTKTTTDGINTSWASSDQLSVFYAKAETKNYSSNLKFENVSGNSFKTSDAVDLSGAAKFDWYAFYPYSDYNKTPEGVDSKTFGYTTIAGNNQTQTGYNNMEHLAGRSLPLYGVINNVDAESTPTFTMHHLTSVILIEVTNNSGAKLTINSASVTTPYDLAGSYFINFADPDNVVYTERSSTHVYKTVNLSVTAGTALADGESAKLYLAVKPFTAAAGDEIKISVNGYEKAIIVPAGGVDFKAGKVNRIKFNYNSSDNTVSWTAATGQLGSTISEVGGTATGKIKTGSFEWNYTRTLVSLTDKKSDYIAISSSESTKGALQLGSGNALEKIVLKTSEITGTIKKVIVNAAGTEHNVSIKVNGTEYLPATTMTSSLADYTGTGTGTESGEIEISIVNKGDTKKAFYLKSITVVY